MSLCKLYENKKVGFVCNFVSSLFCKRNKSDKLASAYFKNTENEYTLETE